MKKFSLIVLGMTLGIILTLVVLWRGLAGEARAQLGEATPEGAGLTSDEGAAQSGFPSFSVDEAGPAPLNLSPDGTGHPHGPAAGFLL